MNLEFISFISYYGFAKFTQWSHDDQVMFKLKIKLKLKLSHTHNIASTYRDLTLLFLEIKMKVACVCTPIPQRIQLNNSPSPNMFLTLHFYICLSFLDLYLIRGCTMHIKYLLHCYINLNATAHLQALFVYHSWMEVGMEYDQMRQIPSHADTSQSDSIHIFRMWHDLSLC